MRRVDEKQGGRKRVNQSLILERRNSERKLEEDSSFQGEGVGEE
jgi:hypothetical protein